MELLSSRQAMNFQATKLYWHPYFEDILIVPHFLLD